MGKKNKMNRSRFRKACRPGSFVSSSVNYAAASWSLVPDVRAEHRLKCLGSRRLCAGCKLDPPVRLDATKHSNKKSSKRRHHSTNCCRSLLGIVARLSLTTLGWGVITEPCTCDRRFPALSNTPCAEWRLGQRPERCGGGSVTR